MLKTYVEDLGQVDNNLHQYYVESDGGGYRLDVEMEDVRGLKSALDKERKTNREYRKQLKKFNDVDLDTYDELVNNVGSKDRWQREKQTLKSQIEERDAKIKSMIMDGVVKKAALEAGVNPEDLDDVLKLTNGAFELADDGRVEVKDTGDAVEDFFKTTYKEARPRYYSGSGKSGTGALPGLKGVGGNPTLEAQYNEAMKKGDLAKAITLKNKLFLK